VAAGVVAGRVGVAGVPAVVRAFINTHVCFHFCACLGVRAYVCTLVWWHMCVSERVIVCACAHVWSCLLPSQCARKREVRAIPSCVCVCVCVRVCVYVRARTRVCMRACVCIYLLTCERQCAARPNQISMHARCTPTHESFLRAPPLACSRATKPQGGQMCEGPPHPCRRRCIHRVR